MINCDLCDVSCDNAANYIAHFTSKRHLQNIALSTKPQKQIVCEQCNIFFKHESHFQSHISSKRHLQNSSTTTYNCEACLINFHGNKHNYDQHMGSANHYKTVNSLKPATSTSKLNDQSFIFSKSTANKIIKTVPVGTIGQRNIPSTSETWNCNKCNVQFTNLQLLKQHNAKSHEAALKSVVENRYLCRNCKRKFTTNYLLEKHMKLHVTGHICLQCNAKFMYKRMLMQHIKRVHVQTMPRINNNNKLECFNCKSLFSSRWMLNRHLKNAMNSTQNAYRQLRICCNLPHW